MSNYIAINIILRSFLEECGGKPRKVKKHYNNRFILRKLLVHNLLKSQKVVKISGYINTIRNYSPGTFREHFRMHRRTFKKLLTILRPFYKKQVTGRPAFNLEFCLYLTIWKLANNSSYREIYDRFGISKGSSFYLVSKICKILYRVRGNFIKWPSPEEFNQIMEDFGTLRSSPFPFVAGCIDGTHIQIPAPSEESDSYYNRKGTHSFILQAVCNAKCIFTDVFFGMPGRNHDANVWSNSPLKRGIANRSVRLPEGAHLLGDSAYPLSTFLMVPYKDNGYLSPVQRKYNTILSKSRVVIEQAFGILKNKFRILKYVDIKNLKNAKFIVIACIVLHNFIIENENLDVEQFGVDAEHIIDDENEEQEPSATTSGSNEAKEKRDNIANLLSG